MINSPNLMPGQTPVAADIHNGPSLPAQASTALHNLADSASHIARESAQAARERAMSLRDGGNAYIRERPMQSMLMAAGAGAMLMLLATLLARGSSR